ncbi:HD-GYP domain-containing protein (c-di-GMP phosphodiesterase class II) [Paenibacillus castaneae]|uniref:HD-GYP domain-containing protein n=1 Tax=Paenibacillus castaneae TaxID=474957 RepID=UPI001FBAEB54|nr:HD-GYP domain-containing protein [Paenibacillus castaneae]NIK78148.1 HD-GYP domain-containing protein (c-di-GMP phosphodiesterase class II) [Paenibacillus castaneae]
MPTNTGVFIRLCLVMLIPFVSYLALRESPFDKSINAPHEHFYIVSAVAALALALAIAVGVVAIQLRNIKISFLSLSYVSLAMMFILHGLSTPGFLMHHTAIASNAAQLSILLAVIWLWLSSLSVDRPIIKWFAMWQRMLLPVWTIILLFFCIILWKYPDIIHVFHLNESSSKWVATLFIVGMNGWTMYRYMQTYLSSRFPLQLAIVYSSGWMIIAQLIVVSGEVWNISWWMYHFLLLASVIIMVSGIVSQYVSSRSISASVKLMFRANPIDWINTYMSNSVRELVMTTEARDSYTAGHNYRVALYALKLGEELSLSSNDLRAIAQGGLVHDVGKLRIPDIILNKPGKLTPEERAVIEVHPVSGYDLCKRLGFMPEELSVIRSHHEKWDGSGYPDKLAAEQIPLLARVTAVADVYDALTSSRSYRKAMSHESAMEIIVKESGKHFDPLCVQAWKRLVQEQPEFFEETVRNSPHLKLNRKFAR